jgi:hypothetical protein
MVAYIDCLQDEYAPEDGEYKRLKHVVEYKILFFFSVPVCAIRASGVPGGTLVSMNRFSALCG